MICYSGGADGADSYFDLIAKKHGIETIHYWHGRKTPLGNHEITKEQLEEGWAKCLEANDKLLHRNGAEKYKNLLARNWFQVKPSESIFAVSRLTGTKNGMVLGGTAWAVAMAVLEPYKKTFVFDMVVNKWFQVTASVEPERSSPYQFDFEELKLVPELPQHFAGIGSRDLTPQGKAAIEFLFLGLDKPAEDD